MKFEELAGLDVAVWGLGREGRAALTVLNHRFPNAPRLILCDEAPSATEFASLTAAERAGVRTGAEIVTALGEVDVVITSPGVSLYREEIVAAKARGVRFTSGTKIWLAEHPEAAVVAVTGTKGKSTTTSLIAHLLEAIGRPVELAGNIGRPLLETEPEGASAGGDGAETIFVVELSSYQTSDVHADVPVAVLLNLFPEHLDWHGDTETYYRDKLALFTGQRTGTAVINATDAVTAGFRDRFVRPIEFNAIDAIHADATTIRDGARPLLAVGDVPLPGRHNLSNVCAALTAIRCLGFDPERAAAAVRTFRPLPHRLSVLGERDGVTYIDDSISTTPQSTVAATESLAGRAITLLVGGHDRGQPLEHLAEAVARGSVQALIAMPASGRRIVDAVRRATAESAGAAAVAIHEAHDLEAAVAIAGAITPSGGVVLLSPSAPSYGAFRDYRERGRAFAIAAGFDCPPED